MSIIFRAKDFIIEKIREFNPLVTTRKGSAIADFLIDIPSILLEQYYLDLEDSLGDGSGLSNYETITENAMDEAAGNLLVTRREGTNGVQTARILVTDLKDYNFGEGELLALDGDSNEWTNSATIAIAAEELVAQRDGVFYYIDLEFTSEEESDNLSDIETLDEDSEFEGFVSIAGDNTTFTDGTNRETNEELFYRCQNSVAARDLTVGKGILSILSEQYGGSFVDIQPIGMGDKEMMRDIPFDFDGNKINLHVGGHTDIYIKTPKLISKFDDVVGLASDTSKEYTKDYSVQLAGIGVAVFVGRGQLISIDSIKTSAGAEIDLGQFTIDLLGGFITPLFDSTDNVVASLTYNPINIDIIRNPAPGRENFTISNLAMIKIVSIEVLDPGSGEPTGTILEQNGGYGYGGFGIGGFGSGPYRDWRFITTYPHEKFSMLEESYIEFEYTHIGKDVRINYLCAPELANIHDFCRSDNERVQCANILPRNFIPVFINGELTLSTAASDEAAPSEEELIEMIETYIRNYGNDRKDFELELVIAELFGNGVVALVKDFEWEGEIIHMDGQVEIIQSDIKLEVPTPDPFPKDTDRPISNDIARYYPGDITLNLTVRDEL